MSLFGPNRPKGITKEELYFVRGELGAGHGAEALSTRQVDYVMELLEMAVDADTPVEAAHHWEQVDQNEEEQVEREVADNRVLRFSDAQRERVHRILEKYIDINRVRSLF